MPTSTKQHVGSVGADARSSLIRLHSSARRAVRPWCSFTRARHCGLRFSSSYQAAPARPANRPPVDGSVMSWLRTALSVLRRCRHRPAGRGVFRGGPEPSARWLCAGIAEQCAEVGMGGQRLVVMPSADHPVDGYALERELPDGTPSTAGRRRSFTAWLGPSGASRKSPRRALGRPVRASI